MSEIGWANTLAARHPVMPARVDHVDNENITVDATAGGKTLTVPTSVVPRYATIQIREARVYYTLDGSAPTATNGGYLDPGDVLPVSTPLADVRLIRSGGVSAVAHVDYFA